MDKDKNPQKPGSDAPQVEKGSEGVAGTPGQPVPNQKPAASETSIPGATSQPKASQNDAPASEPPGGHAPDKAKPQAPSSTPTGKSTAGNSSTPLTGSAAASPYQSSTPSMVKSPPRRGGGKWLALLVILVLAAALYYFLWPLYGDRVVAYYQQAVGGDHSPTPLETTPVQQTEDRGSDVLDGQEGIEPLTQIAANGSSPSLAVADIVSEERSARQLLETELRDQMADLQLQLSSHADRLRQLSTTSREDWLLAEAEYLLRLASQRILTERQTANAEALLESADAILRDMSDPALYPVRKALAEDITRVRMTDAVDREGIFLRLGALVDAVDNLDSLLPEPGAERLPVATSQEPTTWYGRLLANARRALGNMVGLVRVERRDVPLQPMLTLEQEQIMRHNLRMVLEQARLALLREEQVIYSDSLNRASAWIREHFEQNSSAAAFVEELSMLAEQTVSQELPTVTPSLRALQDYIRLWHNRFDPGEAPDTGGELP